MTDRLAALAAAVMLAVTLAACGAADDKTNGNAPDTTPNGASPHSRTPTARTPTAPKMT